MTVPPRHAEIGVLPRRAERGVSLSAFVATIVAALLLMGGLVIDGGAQSTAHRACQQAAAEAARAASDTAAVNRAAGIGSVDTSAVAAAAQSVIATHPGMTGSVRFSGDAVIVTTSATVPTILLSLISIDRLSARGEATVVLVATGG